jgi:hypothetical protein
VKVSQAKPPFIVSPPPHLSVSWQVATADFPRGGGKCASCRRRGNWPWRLAIWRGEGGLIQFDNGLSDLRPMKMDNDVLLLCYLDKIRLTLTGDLWQALASWYIEGEAIQYKGARMATCPQSTTLHSTGNISVWTKEVGHSNTRGTVRLCSFPLKLTAAQLSAFSTSYVD